jgi:hypothetical protein
MRGLDRVCPSGIASTDAVQNEIAQLRCSRFEEIAELARS